jgi:hypothetical protein
MNWKGLEGSGCGLINVCLDLLGGTLKITKVLRIADVLAEIRTEHVLNTSREP